MCEAGGVILILQDINWSFLIDIHEFRVEILFKGT